MKPVRLPAAATNALPRWVILALCLLYILPGLFGRDPWKMGNDAASFGVMWTMAHGSLSDWLWPHVAGLPVADRGPLAFWLGALCIKAFGWLVGDAAAARLSTVGFFLLGAVSVWYATYLLGRRNEAQPLKLAFGGQPEPRDFGRTLADGALLIYLGCLGLFLHSHESGPDALQISLVACAMYCCVRLLDTPMRRGAAASLGLVLGLTTLTRGWVLPAGLWLSLVALCVLQKRVQVRALLLITAPLALALVLAWGLAVGALHPAGSAQLQTWMQWNTRQLDWPDLESIAYLFKYGIWFAWPAWPFAAWAVYAWRKQEKALHIALPLCFLLTFTLLAFLNRQSEQGILLPLLPPLVILAAFGLPTMKRGAINAVDWFAVMVLTGLAAAIWIGWLAEQFGWPPKLAHKVGELAPGYRPEFHPFAFVVAFVATAAWFCLVYWRISRQPSVLWRAVVLSSGGVVLCWVLAMTLWLPWANQRMSYADVARELRQQIDAKVPPGYRCIDSNVDPAQRASFAYFGGLRFAGIADQDCELLLVQASRRVHQKGGGSGTRRDLEQSGQWEKIWQGHRPHDKDEFFTLYWRKQP